MKRFLFAALAALALLALVGCAAEPAEPEATGYYLTDEDVPLDERALSRAVPDFLTEEQQTLYRQAAALYDAMFGGETTGIDYAFPSPDALPDEYSTYTPDGSDYTYIRSDCRWQSWADFDRVVRGVFTDRLWAELNEADFDGSPSVYIEHDGQLYILDCSYGDQYYNNVFPDEFALVEQTDERIEFTVTAHYSYPYPRQGESYEERDERMKTSYEFTLTFPVVLLRTDAGWRFDTFCTGAAAEMRCPDAVFDGITEDDFYANAYSTGVGIPAYPN